MEVPEVFGEKERNSTSRVDSLARKVSSTTRGKPHGEVVRRVRDKHSLPRG